VKASYDVTGAYWNDVGDPATYARGVLDALRERGELVYRSATARCGRLEIDGYVVLESRTEVRDGSRLRNCILLPGAVVSGSHENRIVGPDYTIALSEADMQPALHAAEKKRVALSDPLFASHFGIAHLALAHSRTRRSRLRPARHDRSDVLSPHRSRTTHRSETSYPRNNASGGRWS